MGTSRRTTVPWPMTKEVVYEATEGEKDFLGTDLHNKEADMRRRQRRTFFRATWNRTTETVVLAIVYKHLFVTSGSQAQPVALLTCVARISSVASGKCWDTI